MMRAALLVLTFLALTPTASAITIHARTDPDGSMAFTPKDVRATKGDRVSLTVINDDTDKPHDWALLSYDGKDIEAYTRAGETKTIEFTAAAAGSFRIVCQVVGHKQAGMQGAFVVEKGSLVPDVTLLGALAAAAASAIILARRR